MKMFKQILIFLFISVALTGAAQAKTIFLGASNGKIQNLAGGNPDSCAELDAYYKFLGNAGGSCNVYMPLNFPVGTQITSIKIFYALAANTSLHGVVEINHMRANRRSTNIGDDGVVEANRKSTNTTDVGGGGYVTSVISSQNGVGDGYLTLDGFEIENGQSYTLEVGFGTTRGEVYTGHEVKYYGAQVDYTEAE